MLVELRLEGNRLASLASNAFAKLTSLRVLHLEFNQISQIRPNAFNGLRKLVELHLNDNRLRPALNGSLIDQILGNETFGDSDELRRTIDELRRLADSDSIRLIGGSVAGDLNPVNTFVNSHLNSVADSQPGGQLNDPLHNQLNNQLNNGDLTNRLSALHLSNFNELKYLDLSNNPLFLLNGLNSPFSSVHPAAKANVTSQLDTLLLTNCSLFAVDASSFGHLTNLVKLDLSGNLLSVSLFNY